MAKVILALGPITFRDFELPPRISFGGRQRLAIHRLADGRRVIDCLGRDDANIQFSGMLAGPDATSRAQALDTLRSTGTVVPLTWDVFFYSALVAEFSAAYCNDTWIPYTLKCTILRDEAALMPDLTPSLVQMMANDVASASSVLTGTSIDLDTLRSALATPGSTSYGSSGFQTTQNAVQSTTTVLQAQNAKAEQQLTTLDLDTGSSQDALANLSLAAVAAGQVATLRRALGFIGEANARLAAGA